MSRKSCIVIAEDYTILREGSRSLLSSSPEFEIVGEAEDGRRAIKWAQESKPDLYGPLHAKDGRHGRRQRNQARIDKHRANLMNKLNLHGVAALTALAIEKGLVSRE